MMEPRLSNLNFLEITWLVSGRAGIWAQVCLIPLLFGTNLELFIRLY